MSPLGGLFGRKQKPPEPEPDSAALLKAATARQKAGDIEGAIALVEQACQAIQRDPNWLSSAPCLEPFLKLARYYQQAGRNDDAWKRFNQTSLDAMRSLQGSELYFALSNVSDQQRLFLHREKKDVQAVQHGVFAFLYLAQAWWHRIPEEKAAMAKLAKEYRRLQMDMEPPSAVEHFQTCLAEHTSSENIRAAMVSLLKPAKRMDTLDNLVLIVQDEVASLPKIQLPRADAKLRDLLKKEATQTQ